MFDAYFDRAVAEANGFAQRSNLQATLCIVTMDMGAFWHSVSCGIKALPGMWQLH